MRNLSLESVAYELGLNVDLKRSQVWRSQDCEIYISDRKFYDWQAMKGGVGAIDLVMHVRQCDFRKAVLWLRDRLGESATLQSLTDQADELFQAEPKPQSVMPVAEKDHWQQARKYLTQVLKLPVPLVDRLHQQKLVYTDSSQRLVFVHRDLENGAAIGATQYSLETQAYENQHLGSRNGFYLQAGKNLMDQPSRLVLVDSPLDAISKFVLEYPQQPRARYFALNGAVDFSATNLQQFGEVVVACPDPEQRKIASERLASRSVSVVQQNPKVETWHQDLVDEVLLVESRWQIVEPQPRRNSTLELD